MSAMEGIAQDGPGTVTSHGNMATDTLMLGKETLMPTEVAMVRVGSGFSLHLLHNSFQVQVLTTPRAAPWDVP